MSDWSASPLELAAIAQRHRGERARVAEVLLWDDVRELLERIRFGIEQALR